MTFVNPTVLRSRLVLEVASQLVSTDATLRPIEVTLGIQQPLRLSGGSNIDAMRRLCDRKTDMAMANPSSALMLAYRGRGPFSSPQPVRTIAVIPSEDQYLFAVSAALGVNSFEEIALKRPPLKVLLRGTPDHCLHYMLDDVVAAAGFALSDIPCWGGEVRKVSAVPPDQSKFDAVVRGEMNAIFDEAAPSWLDTAIDSDMTILSLSEAMMLKLEGMGYRRAVLEKSKYPRLQADILTLDFSGWPIFVLADLPDERVTQICAALNARAHAIPWEDGALPLSEMCRDTAAAPVSVPFHPAAERFWRDQGYQA